MPKCPNCARETKRTTDWACQWCGYPLLSDSYEMVPKTFRQLKEEALHKAEPTPPPDAEPAAEAQAKPVVVPEPEASVIPLGEPRREQLPEPEKAAELQPGPGPGPEPVPQPEPAAEELTVDELIAVYEQDAPAADARFLDKRLMVTGVVALVDVKDTLDTHYVRLAGAEGDISRSVKCLFDKKHAPALSQLEKGQTLTVQGRFNGSLIAIRMIDCELA